MFCWLQVGSADHQIHYFDLRNPSKPLFVFRGHRKAVSYVKFLSSNELASASTDSTLRLWDVQTDSSVCNHFPHFVIPGGILFVMDWLWSSKCAFILKMLMLRGRFDMLLILKLDFWLPQIRTFRGHTNEKNFVGLTVNSEYIACGSETNEVFVYHKVQYVSRTIKPFFFVCCFAVKF